ncbi:MAG: peptidoglycan-associated lipoprotein Pal [Alphaproteobacteria bacterium]|nr:peptidoglycan-associated lipoprotein Pal [Alphaproteobacteria bacterium]
MKSKLLTLVMISGLLAGCSTMDKPSDMVVQNENGTFGWGEDIDISSLKATDYAKRFESDVDDIVFFSFNQYDLSKDSLDTLKTQIDWLKDHPKALVLIEGHADERGTREYNLALGERRAESIVQYLIANGISSARIKLISYGKERPMVSGSNEEAWSKNRRAVTKVQ